MTEYAFAPMDPPKPEGSVERMKAILERRCREAGHEVRIETRPPERTVAPLVWEKPVHTRDANGTQTGAGYQTTVCHRFVVAKVRMSEGFLYTASMRRKAPDGSDFPAQVLGSRKTAEEARALCQEAAK